MVVGLTHLEPGATSQVSADALRELGVGIDTRAHRGAAEGQFGQLLRHEANAVGRSLDLAGVAEELLAETDGRRVLQVRPSRLDYRHELFGLPVECVLEVGQRRYELFVDRDHGRELHRGGDHVVTRLAPIDVVVWMDWLPRS